MATVSETAAAVGEKLKMTAHPPVTVALVAGAIANVTLKVLTVTSPELAAVLAGSEGDITIIVAALAGYLTGRA